MRVLITNDDGIDAPGLAVLHDIARQFTDDVVTVAPAYEQSGVGHCITFTKPLGFTKRSDTSYAVDGSPADCVIVGLFEILRGNLPDLILSGVNKGNNAGQYTLYSGTVGATIEAAMQGVPSIALSQFYGPALDGHDMFSASRAYGAQVVQALLDHGQWAHNAQTTFYNVNFPPVLADDVKGMKATAQGFRAGPPFGTTHKDGKLWLAGTNPRARTADGTDVAANLDGYVAITPCHVDLTVHEHIADLQGTLS